MGLGISGEMGIDGFRGSAARGYLPKASEISSLGLYNEYFFAFDKLDTEKLVEAKTYCARMKDPLTEEMENYLAVSLISSQDGKNHREPLNLIICLDISGSMKYTIDYDWSSDVQKEKTKLEISIEMIQNILKKLKPNENVGLVLFDHNVSVFQEIKSVSELNFEELFEKVSKIKERGGTNIEGGLKKSIEQLRKLQNTDPSSKNNMNRIVFLTDGEPNYSSSRNSEDGVDVDDETVLLKLTKEAAEEHQIYTTFIGIGCDFNEGLIKKLSKVKGGNYFSAHTNSQFIRILDDEFNYIVTPIAFNIDLTIQSDDFNVSKIYGTTNDELESTQKSHENNKTPKKNTYQLMKIDTVLAGAKDERGTKGGVILIKLDEKLSLLSEEENKEKKKIVKLVLEYETLNGEKSTVRDEIDFNTIFSFQNKQEEEEGENDESIYQNLGVRKSILLAKYNDFVKYVINSVHHQQNLNAEDMKHLTVHSSFKGVTFKISERMKSEIHDFSNLYFKREMAIMSDDAKLGDELEILERFIITEEFKSKLEEDAMSTRKEIEDRMVNGLSTPGFFMFSESSKHKESIVNSRGDGMKGICRDDILRSTWYCGDCGKCNTLIPPSIEIVFSFDVTGSMTQYIEEVRKNLKEIVKTLLQDIPTIRIGLIAHSDYCDHKSSYCLKKLELTNHLPTLTQFIEVCGNGGGGDADENYEQVLSEVRSLKWSEESSSKCLVMIGDCDPHPKDSYFGIDWEVELKKCKEMGIKCYGVQCGSYPKTGFYERISEETGGQRIMLSDFKDMVEVFVGLCYREDTLIHLKQKGEEIVGKCSDASVNTSNNNKEEEEEREREKQEFVICLDDIGGRIDLFGYEELIRIHKALHDPKAPEEIQILPGGRPVKFSQGKAGVRYLRVSDLMFIQQFSDGDSVSRNVLGGKEKTERLVTWISISGQYGYIVQNL